ncbi:MAG TPA: hypothetical protein VFC44_24385 [Candidatus Saccharimonadales bacterium]|nr:hypothetical protein [Candidatus Saccharimonadales bacterium]
MSFDLAKTLESKRASRRTQAARLVAEKLQILAALRQRALDIRGKAAGKAEGKRKKEEN